MTNKIYVVVDKRTGEFIYFHPRTEDAETSPGYGEFYTDTEEIDLDFIIYCWPEKEAGYKSTNPAPTLDDLEIVEYVRAEVV